jgi:glutamate synthase (NADPH/NADH) small chain
VYAVSTQEFLGGPGPSSGTEQQVRGLRLVEVDATFQAIPGSEREIPAQLVLLAMGFTGPQPDGLLEQLGVALDDRGNVARDASYATSEEAVFVAGDAGRGQSLIVWAIAEGRSAAAAVDRYLTGGTSLPSPIPPTERPLAV